MALVVSKDSASWCLYAPYVAEQGEFASDPITLNLDRLRKECGWSGAELARKSKVSQTHVSAILRGNTSPTLEKADALARPFGLEGWCLAIPDLPEKAFDAQVLMRLVKQYLKTDDGGRLLLDTVLKREEERPDGNTQKPEISSPLPARPGSRRALQRGAGR